MHACCQHAIKVNLQTYCIGQGMQCVVIRGGVVVLMSNGLGSCPDAVLCVERARDRDTY